MESGTERRWCLLLACALSLLFLPISNHTPTQKKPNPASPPTSLGRQDIAFEIGRFYYGIREYDKALAYYCQSSETIGEHHVTFHNMGLCHYSMGAYVA